jgi:hypothetical protein
LRCREVALQLMYVDLATPKQHVGGRLTRLKIQNDRPLTGRQGRKECVAESFRWWLALPWYC